MNLCGVLQSFGYNSWSNTKLYSNENTEKSIRHIQIPINMSSSSVLKCLEQKTHVMVFLSQIVNSPIVYVRGSCLTWYHLSFERNFHFSLPLKSNQSTLYNFQSGVYTWTILYKCYIWLIFPLFWADSLPNHDGWIWVSTFYHKSYWYCCCFLLNNKLHVAAIRDTLLRILRW